MPKRFEPLVKAETARALMCATADVLYGADEFEADVECGEFTCVFDIACVTPPRDLRLFKPCVDQRIAKYVNPKWRVKEFTIDDVLHALFPNQRLPYTKTPLIEAAFTCSPDLVIDLIDAGHLKQFGKSEYRRGRGGDALVTLESISAFLKARQLR